MRFLFTGKSIGVIWLFGQYSCQVFHCKGHLIIAHAARDGGDAVRVFPLHFTRSKLGPGWVSRICVGDPACLEVDLSGSGDVKKWSLIGHDQMEIGLDGMNLLPGCRFSSCFSHQPSLRLRRATAN